MREKLRSRLQEREQELSNLRSSLSQYQVIYLEKKKDQTKLFQAAGPDFAPIVLEFARLQKEIEGKKWALSELGRAALPAL